MPRLTPTLARVLLLAADLDDADPLRDACRQRMVVACLQCQTQDEVAALLGVSLRHARRMLSAYGVQWRAAPPTTTREELERLRVGRTWDEVAVVMGVTVRQLKRLRRVHGVEQGRRVCRPRAKPAPSTHPPQRCCSCEACLRARRAA